MTRSEHLKWCKDRAHEYADSGDGMNAITSMLSDINKHPETAMNGPLAGVLMMAAIADKDNPTAVKRWIDGFN